MGCLRPAGQQKMTISTTKIIPNRVHINQTFSTWNTIKLNEYIEAKHIPAVIKNCTKVINKFTSKNQVNFLDKICTSSSLKVFS